MRVPGRPIDYLARQEQKVIQDDKIHFLETWAGNYVGEDRRRLVTLAIRAGILGELLARDEREYNIPQTGARMLHEITLSKCITPKVTSFADPDRMRDTHSSEDAHHEYDRRRLAFFALRPKYEHWHDWFSVIEDDDGKDADGNWLCQRHSGRTKTFAEQMVQDHGPDSPPDKPIPRADTGFGDDTHWRKPKWLRPGGVPAEWCERPATDEPATADERTCNAKTKTRTVRAGLA